MNAENPEKPSGFFDANALPLTEVLRVGGIDL